MKNAILKVLKYFRIFSYPPTFEEIYTFLPKKISKKELKKELERLVKKKIIGNWKLEIGNFPRYTIGEYGIKTQISNLKSQNYRNPIAGENNLTIKQFNNFNKRYFESRKKLENWRFKFYIKLLFLFPQIKLVGLSGSISMMNAKENDDIDLFIITAKNRLFTGRFIAVILAQILGIRRARDSVRPIFITREFHPPKGGFLESKKIVRASFLKHKNKICLNLFFDESQLEVPDFKKTEYVGHEILQMKPIINKDQTYEKFLLANKWVLKFFPNAKKISNLKTQNSKPQLKTQKFLNNFKFLTAIFNFGFLIFNFIEDLLKRFQLYFINRHKTTEIVTNTQLWFHPKDFGRKIKMLKKDRD